MFLVTHANKYLHPCAFDGVVVPGYRLVMLCVMTSGQFSREPEVRVYGIHPGVDPLKKEAVMEVKGNRLQVTR